MTALVIKVKLLKMRRDKESGVNLAMEPLFKILIPPIRLEQKEKESERGSLKNEFNEMARATLFQVCAEDFFVASFILFFTCYHIYLAFKVLRDPYSTTIGQNYEMRRAWSEMMIANPGKHFTAVQTIRNLIMSASMLASTSVALNTATFVFLINYENIPGIADLNLFGTDRIKPAYKLLSLTLCFLFSFFCYMQSIRMNNHAGFQISMNFDTCRFIDLQIISDNLNTSANFFTVGSRGYFFAFINILWLFGPLPPFIGTICLIPVMWYLDIGSAKRANKYANEHHLPPSPAEC